MQDAFLTRSISNFRRYTDEPSVNAKYSDAALIEMIEESYSHIISEVNRCSPEPIVARFEVTYVADTETYILPQLIQSIHAIYHTTDSGYKIFYTARSGYNPLGRRVWVEGSILHIQTNVLSPSDVLTIEYIPSGTARLHDGTCTIDSTGKLVTFGATPTDGALDTHVNAYAGAIFRLITSTDANFAFLQERTIKSYAHVTRIATLDTALSPNPESTGTTSYEIAPAIHRGLDHAVALYLAYWIASIEGSITRSRLLKRMFQDILRNLRLSAYYSNLLEAPKARADNFNNRRYLRTVGRT